MLIETYHNRMPINQIKLLLTIDTANDHVLLQYIIYFIHIDFSFQLLTHHYLITYSMINLNIQFSLQQFLILMKQKQNQKDKIQTKMKYMYSALQFQKQLKKKKEMIQCYHCSSWQQKTQELVWQYEQLLMIKEKQIQTLTKMVQKLDDELKKTQGKVDVLSKKTKHYELSIERQRPSLIETQNIITYYKERQVELLNQLKMAEGELFTKNIFYKDQIQMKQDKVLRQIGNLQANRSAKEIIHLKPNHVIQQEYNQSMLSNSSSMAKVLHQNFCDLQKMNQEKMILELKNRIANLKAIQLTVLK